MGSAYPTIAADAAARFQVKLSALEVQLQFGKVGNNAHAAEAQGKTC